MAGHTGDGDERSRQRAPSELLLRRLLTMLIERTEHGAAEWEIDDAQPDSFCLVGDGWVVATRSVDGDGTHPYALVVGEGAGEAVVEARSTSAFGRPLADAFARLHAAAAATATLAHADPLLTRIVSELAASRAPVDHTPAKAGDGLDNR